jgi:hypothetical protein
MDEISAWFIAILRGSGFGEAAATGDRRPSRKRLGALGIEQARAG